MAKEEDQAFLMLMRELGTEPKESVQNQNLRLEYRLIITSFFAIMFSWIATYLLLSYLNLIFLAFLAMCNAICIDYVLLELVTKVSFRAKGNKL